jgi:thymidylate synthase
MEFLDDITEEELNFIRNHRKMKQHQEYGYLALLDNILKNGVEKLDRTGTGTKSLFGTQLEFDLKTSFPILTTKKVFWKGVVEELLWFIRGETDSKLLEAKGVNIWKGNTSREFLDNHKPKLRYPEGEIGPGYGFQWRHSGALYEVYDPTMPNYMEEFSQIAQFKINGNYGVAKTLNGIDQLQNVIDRIKSNPNDRRLIVSAWNVEQLDKMSLPPCHLLYQFYVENGELSCQWYQRSVDTFLGLPFNISSYALLTCLIAQVTGLKPGKIVFVGGDTHLYLNHLEQAKEQLTRTPFPFPQLNIKKPLSSLADIEALQLEDLELVGYQSHKSIKADMAV